MRVLAVLLLSAGVLSACSSHDELPADPGPAASSTPLASYDTTGFAVPRADVCGLVPEAAAVRALGGEVASTSVQRNGDEVEVSPGVTDIAHEFSCGWTSADGTTASLWVFVPPVTTGEARDLARGIARDRGCRAVSGPEFGDQSVVTACHRGQHRTELAFHGLFGDAWLSCAMTGPGMPSVLRERAGSWCIDVLAAVRVSS